MTAASIGKAMACLHTLARWEQGEAALALAQEVDGHRQAEALLSAARRRADDLGGAHARASAEGHLLNPALLAVLSQQLRAGENGVAQARQSLDEAQMRREAAQQALGTRQSRTDALHEALRQAQRAAQTERQRREQHMLDDLVAAGRWISKEE